MDVEHDAHGPGGVWGSGRGVVTVRFETAASGPGRVHSFAADDPALRPRRIGAGGDPEDGAGDGPKDGPKDGTEGNSEGD